MKKTISITISCLFIVNVYSQRIVDNVILNDIDYYNQTDTLLAKLKYHTVDLYERKGDLSNNNSFKLCTRKKFNNNGYLIELIKGKNIDDGSIDYSIKYERKSDSLYETITRYPFNSNMIDNSLFVDSLINGQVVRACLYKQDIDKGIYVKSVYRINRNENIIDIKRYDLENKLMQIFYPTGSRMPQKEVIDSVISEYATTVTYQANYAENEFKLITVFNKKNKIIQKTSQNTTYNNGFRDFIKQIIVYNVYNYPIISTVVDENNTFISEEKYYYKEKGLVRYTKDDDYSDEEVNEERRYNESGQIVFYKSRPINSNNNTIWKYYYGTNGLREKEEHYVNEKLELTRVYKYH